MNILSMFSRSSNQLIEDVPGDGDCFFHALYRAAKHQGILENVARAFDFGGSDGTDSCWDQHERTTDMTKKERSFISCVRVHLSKNVHNYDTEVFNFRIHLLDIADIATEAYGAPIAQAAHNRKTFTSALASYIASNGNWVSAFEVSMVTKMLAKANIELRVLSDGDSFPEVITDKKIGMDYVIVLVNVGNRHYKFARYRKAQDGEDVQWTYVGGRKKTGNAKYKGTPKNRTHKPR